MCEKGSLHEGGLHNTELYDKGCDDCLGEWVENSCVLKMWWVCGLLVRATKGVPWCTRASDVICLNRKQTHTLAQTHTQTHIHTRSHEH
jgi:hypothetical protein